MVKFTRKKKMLFDEDADWVPPKGRPFKMKTGTQPTDTPTEPPTDSPPKREIKDQRPITNAEGLDRACADLSNVYLDSQGALCVAGTNGNLFSERMA